MELKIFAAVLPAVVEHREVPTRVRLENQRPCSGSGSGSERKHTRPGVGTPSALRGFD